MSARDAATLLRAEDAILRHNAGLPMVDNFDPFEALADVMRMLDTSRPSNARTYSPDEDDDDEGEGDEP